MSWCPPFEPTIIDPKWKSSLQGRPKIYLKQMRWGKVWETIAYRNKGNATQQMFNQNIVAIFTVKPKPCQSNTP